MIGSNPRAVVTGAGGGLGRAIAKKLAERGGHILVSDIDVDGANETKRIVESLGGRAEVERCDVSKSEEVERLRDRAMSALGGVDFIVNNAGVAVGGPIGKVPLSDWEWIVGINLMGVVYGCHFFVPILKQQGSGHVLNVASIAGITYAPDMGPYNATKAAVVALTETLAVEVGKSGVGATVLCPYFFQTHIDKPMIDQIDKLMKQNKVDADEVAARALKACDRNELFCFPHAEAKVLQGLKRISPTAIGKLFPMMEKLMRS